MKMTTTTLGTPGSWLAAAALLAAGCATSTEVRSQAATGAAPGDYASFRLNEPTVGPADATLSQMLVEGLEAKGYEQGGPDAGLVVTYKLLLGSAGGEESASNTPTIVHDDMFSRPVAPAKESKILLVLIQDSRTLDTLWVGWSQAETREQDVEQRARRALEELVEQLPSRDEAAARPAER